MDAERLADDIAGGHARIERGERVLEDDLHRAPVRPQLGLAEIGDVLAVDPDAAAGRLDQAQDAARHRRFAAAGFADQPERFPDAEREADAIDRMHGADLAAQDAAAHRIVFDEVRYLQQRARVRSWRRPRFRRRASTPPDDWRQRPATADIPRGSARSPVRSAARTRSRPAGWSATAPCRESRPAAHRSLAPGSGTAGIEAIRPRV